MTMNAGPWGDVPVDGDLAPFTKVASGASNRRRLNKKHHYISVTYMEGFADAGRVWAYRLDAPASPLRIRPEGIGYENHYYSQKLADGGRDNHRFEDLWGLIETVWPATLQALKARRVSSAVSFNTLGMATLMRVRVPAARDRNALLLAAKLRAEVQALDRRGLLPAELERYAGQLDTVPIGINPAETLAAMRNDFKAFGDLCFQLGFEVLHNVTDLPFITSDNPVCIYDPMRQVGRRRPYEFNSAVELLCPLDAYTLLRGRSHMRPGNVISNHSLLEDRREVSRINRTIAQFAYGLVVAQNRSSEGHIQRYSGTGPTVSCRVRETDNEIQLIWRNVFGPRPILSSFIDTPEKAARLEAKMAADTADDAGHTDAGRGI